MWFAAVGTEQAELTQYHIGERYPHVIKVYLEVSTVDLICGTRNHNSGVKGCSSQPSV